ncbi:MAG: hypothetical protein IT291_08625 [Deltaproteobacteria bacterium]|nr:hypothetical protein [Deltaproteobacteria bacterium]
MTLLQDSIAKALSALDYNLASQLALSHAKSVKTIESYIDACGIIYKEGNYELSQHIAAELCKHATNYSAPLLTIFALSLISNKQTAHAKEVLRALVVVNPESSSWANELVESNEKDLVLQMSRSSQLEANILRAYSINKDNIIHVILSIRCKSCLNEFRYSIKGSLFRFDIIPCDKCFHPCVTRPRLVASHLRNSSKIGTFEELYALDLLLWSWVHNWWRPKPCPKMSITETSNNLYSMLYFSIRLALGEVYSKIIAKKSAMRN